MAGTLNRLTARSVVLSVLLGAHPAWASASELVTLTADFGIKEP
jgi:phenylacetic acid degradation operon negative regulatory protein